MYRSSIYYTILYYNKKISLYISVSQKKRSIYCIYLFRRSGCVLMVAKRVLSCVPGRLHKEALLEDISWSKATCLGIEMLLGKKADRSEEKKRLRREMKAHKIKYDYYKQELDKIEEAETKERKTAQDKIGMENAMKRLIKENIPLDFCLSRCPYNRAGACDPYKLPDYF